MTEYYVGQEVLIRSVNQRGSEPEKATVTKVGRKLVTVRNQYNWFEVYRMDTGKRNDNYGHEWLQTPEAYADEQHRTELWGQLRELGLKTEWGKPTISTVKLERIIAILEES